MKSTRMIRLLESPDTPYSCNKRKAREEEAPMESQYKTSLTPPSWPTDLQADVAADRKLARAETAMAEIARREQILATQVKAHHSGVAQLAEERALLEAERIEHAKKVKLADDALARVREQLALEAEALEAKRRSQSEADAQREAALRADVEARTAQKPQGADGSGRAGNSAPDAGQLLSQLAMQAADFAALTETVTAMQRQLAEERTEHAATTKSTMDELCRREEALAQREAEADKRINAAMLQLDSDLQNLETVKAEFTAAKREHAEWQLKLEATEAEVAKREKELALDSAKLSEEKARLMAKRNAIAVVEDGHREREEELLRLEQDARQRAEDLARRQSVLATTEAQVRAAGQEALAAQESRGRLQAELDAGLAKLRSDTEAVALARQEQATISAALEQRSADLAKRDAALEHVAREADNVRQQADELSKERLALESKLASLGARETALEEKRVAFDECRRKFRETFSTFMDA